MDAKNEDSLGVEVFLQVWQGLNILGLAGFAGTLVLANAEWGSASFVFALVTTILAGVIGFFSGAMSGRPVLRAARRMFSLRRRASRKKLTPAAEEVSKARVRLPSATGEHSNAAIPAGTVDEE